MKKVMKIFSCLALVMVMIQAFAACSLGKRKIESMVVKNGTLDYAYLINEEVDFSNLVVIVRYNDNTNEEIKADKLKISEFDTSKEGTYDVSISYEDKTITVKLKVTSNEDEVYLLSGVETPETINNYRSNAGLTSEGKENSDYKVLEKEYYVGDDNPYVLMPGLRALDDEDKPIEIKSSKSVMKVYLLENNVETEVNVDAENQYVEVDPVKSSFDFKEAAIGKKFRVEVYPFYLTDEQKLDLPTYTVTHEFRVVDGYNVTHADELTLFTNLEADYRGRTGYEYLNTFLQDMKDFRNTKLSALHGKDFDAQKYSDNLNGLVFHDNIKVTKDNLPEFLFDGKFLQDHVDIYYREITKDFNIYGNYFTLDMSSFPFVKILSTNTDKASHSTLFKTRTTKEYENSNFTMQDLSLIGNSPRFSSGEATDEEKFGGLILMKTKNHKATYENLLINRFFIGIFSDPESEQQYTTKITISNVKYEEAFQCFIYTWGRTEMNITNSEFIGSGGPGILSNHPDSHLPGHEHRYPLITIDEKTNFETNVNGNDAWFAYYNTNTVLNNIIAIDKAICLQSATDGKCKSILSVSSETDSRINFIGLIFPNLTAELFTNGGKGVQGKIILDIANSEDDKTLVNKIVGENLSVEGKIAETHGQAPVFQNDSGEIVYFNGTYLLDANDVQVNNGSEFFKTEYISLYYLGMALLLEAYEINVPAAYLVAN